MRGDARRAVTTWARLAPGWQLELVEILGVVAAAALVWAFAELYDAVRDGASLDLDTRIMEALRPAGEPGRTPGPDWLETAMRDATALGGTLIVTSLTLLAAAYLALAGRRGAALFVLVSVAGAALLSTALKEVLGRERPPYVADIAAGLTSSFPSGHSTGAAAAYLTLGALLARFEPRRALKAFAIAVAVVVTVAVGVSRVYLGVHWPTDVLAGWTLGAAWALLCWTVARLLQQRGEMELTPEETP